MSEDDKPKGSWWQTVPGTLTALSGVFTAVAGLLVALNQTGFLGLKEKPPTAAVVSSSDRIKQAQETKPSAADPATAASPAPASAQVIQTQPDPAKHGAKSAAAHYQIAFPSGDEVTLKNYASEATFKILQTEVTSRNNGKLTLKLFIRLINKGRVALSFGSDSFRLQVDGVPRTPVSWLNDMVEGRSAKEADFLFEIPETAQTLELTVDTGQDTATIPLALKTAR